MVGAWGMRVRRLWPEKRKNNAIQRLPTLRTASHTRRHGDERRRGDTATNVARPDVDAHDPAFSRLSVGAPLRGHHHHEGEDVSGRRHARRRHRSRPLPRFSDSVPNARRDLELRTATQALLVAYDMAGTERFRTVMNAAQPGDVAVAVSDLGTLAYGMRHGITISHRRYLTCP